MKNLIKLILLLFLSICSYGQEHTITVPQNDGGLETISLKEFEQAFQDVLDLNQLDFLFSKEEKQKGITIVINDFVKSFYDSINLSKFNTPVSFKRHREILDEQNEKFFDISKNSVFIKDNKLYILLSLRYKYTGIQGVFERHENSWRIIHKERYTFSNESIPVYRFIMDKEQCLSECIKELKGYQKSYYDSRKCNQYGFN